MAGEIHLQPGGEPHVGIIDLYTAKVNISKSEPKGAFEWK